MKNTFRLDKFLKNLPTDFANEISDRTKDMEKPVVKRRTESCEMESLEKNTSAGYISTPQMDRDSEIVVSHGIDLEAYKANPILLYNHNWQNPPIGSQPEIGPDAKGLFAKQNYASTPFAQDINTLVREKHLRMFSIGFIPLERIHKSQEGFQDVMEAVVDRYGDAAKNADKTELITIRSILLENSVVNIPSNTGAEIITVGKSLCLDPETIELLGLEIIDDEEEESPVVKVRIKPRIKLVKRAEPLDIAGMVANKLSLMKGGI